MLDADAPVLREGAHGVLGRQVARVQVVGDVGRLEVEQPLQMRQVRLEGSIRQQIFEIARVLGRRARARRAPARKCASARRRPPERAPGWRWAVPAAPARSRAPAGSGSRAHPPPASPSRRSGPGSRGCGQERVGDAGQPLQRLGVIRGQRLVGQVAAGQHDRPASPSSSRWCSGVLRQEEPHAAVQRGSPLGSAVTTPSASGGSTSRRPSPGPSPGPPRRRSTSTIGRAGETSSASSSADMAAWTRAVSRSRTITRTASPNDAYGRRRRATATGSVASQARW